jgi:anti-anti-sigma factor
MSQKSSILSQDIYHRIYWYAKRKVDPLLIAHTLNLPVKTVENIVEKLAANKQLQSLHKTSAKSNEPDLPIAEVIDNEHFLDVFIFAKTRHLVLDISGSLDRHNLQKLSDEVTKLKSSELRAIAIKLTDIKMIDEDGFAALLSMHLEFKKMGKFTAILDPSPVADAFLQRTGNDKKIHIFGTESAFEAKAFR